MLWATFPVNGSQTVLIESWAWGQKKHEASFDPRTTEQAESTTALPDVSASTPQPRLKAASRNGPVFPGPVTWLMSPA